MSGSTTVSASTKMGSADITIKANWTVNKYKITFSDSLGATEETYRNVEFGKAYGTLPSPTKSGYTFDGWKNPSGTKASASDLMGASDITLTALWTKIPVTHSISYDGLSWAYYSTLPDSYTEDSGSISIPNPSWDGCTFKGWEKDGSFVGTSYSLNTNSERADVHLEATWTPNTYTISYPATLPAHVYKSSATGSPTPTQFKFRDGTTLPDINTYYYADRGYTISWDRSANISSTPGNVSVGIIVTPISYTCSFYAGGNFIDSVRITYGESNITAPTAKIAIGGTEVEIANWTSSSYGNVSPGSIISNTLTTTDQEIIFNGQY